MRHLSHDPCRTVFSGGVADYRCYTPTSFRKMANRTPKTGLWRGALQKKLASKSLLRYRGHRRKSYRQSHFCRTLRFVSRVQGTNLSLTFRVVPKGGRFYCIFPSALQPRLVAAPLPVHEATPTTAPGPLSWPSGGFVSFFGGLLRGEPRPCLFALGLGVTACA